MIEVDKIGNVEIYKVSMDHVETLSIAFVVRAGSVHESDSEAGAAHFLEHVVFRGTKNFTMKELKLAVEKVGGTLNAFTGRLSTVYYAKIPSFQAEEAFGVLYDLVRFPLINKDAVEIERKIIMEEYKMSLEVPEERLHDLAISSVWPGPYGRDTIGKEETIKSINDDVLRKFHDSRYTSNKLKVVVVGDIESIEDKLKKLDNFKKVSNYEDPKEPIFHHNESVKSQTMRDLKHVHVLLLKEGVGRSHKDYEKITVLDTMLGSGMSSYLFEEIREKLGTVYDISSENLSLRNMGMFGIYFSTSPENVETTLNKIIESLRKFNVEHYFDYGVKRRLGKLLMMVESTGGMMGYVVGNLSSGCEVTDVKEMEDRIKSITISEMKEFTEKILNGRWEAFAVGPEGFFWDIPFVEI